MKKHNRILCFLLSVMLLFIPFSSISASAETDYTGYFPDLPTGYLKDGEIHLTQLDTNNAVIFEDMGFYYLVMREYSADVSFTFVLSSRSRNNVNFVSSDNKGTLYACESPITETHTHYCNSDKIGVWCSTTDSTSPKIIVMQLIDGQWSMSDSGKKLNNWFYYYGTWFGKYSEGTAKVIATKGNFVSFPYSNRSVDTLSWSTVVQTPVEETEEEKNKNYFTGLFNDIKTGFVDSFNNFASDLTSKINSLGDVISIVIQASLGELGTLLQGSLGVIGVGLDSIGFNMQDLVEGVANIPKTTSELLSSLLKLLFVPQDSSQYNKFSNSLTNITTISTNLVNVFTPIVNLQDTIDTDTTNQTISLKYKGQSYNLIDFTSKNNLLIVLNTARIFMSAFCYVYFFRRLYKKLPSILKGVNDLK